jgi:hypothetical protein
MTSPATRAARHRAQVETEGGSVARAKQTNRAEARRRYRQATSDSDIDLEQELDAEDAPAGATARPAGRSDARTASSPTGRPSFFGSFRLAYHPARIREDLPLLPKLLLSRAFIIGLGLVLGGAAAFLAFPRMTGGSAAWDLLVVPTSALLPALAVGFFAPRASYLLGFIVGLVQAVIYALLLDTYVGIVREFGGTVTPEAVNNLRISGLISGPFYALLFAAGAAWYRRFLAISSPRRVAGTRGQTGRGARPAPPRRAAGR